MDAIFNFLGSILGYILWFFYYIVGNYGVAIILFTILFKVILFPLSVKQQKSMAVTSRIAEKQKELSKKYANDKAKYQEEVQKLYAKEGAKPGGGCLTTLLPFPLMIGLYYTILNPLQNALHLSSEVIANATNLLNQIPGASMNIGGRFSEMSIIRHFDQLSPYLKDILGADYDKVQHFSHSFNFLGLDLLGTPSSSPWSSMLFLIPLICLLASIGSQVFMMLTNEAMKGQQGCMKFVMLALPLFTAWLAWTMPGAIGFYWICNTVTMFAQTIVINYFFSSGHMAAKAEARHIAKMELVEASIVEIPVEQRKKLFDKSESEKKQKLNKKKK